MTTSRRALGLGGSIVAATAALVLVGSSAASAHHCYKDEWQAAAYEHHRAGGTAWMSLSDMGQMFLIQPEDQAKCGWVADEAVADFMAEKKLTQEPLIHTKATTGGGAAHQGKTVKPFSYLSDADFEGLTINLMEKLEACKAA